MEVILDNPKEKQMVNRKSLETDSVEQDIRQLLEQSKKSLE